MSRTTAAAYQSNPEGPSPILPQLADGDYKLLVELLNRGAQLNNKSARQDGDEPSYSPRMSSKAKPADDELLQQLLLEPVKVESAPVVIPVIITETQEWVTIRGLEVEIADTFGFYSSIDWYAKSHKEPTGIPRNGRDYDHHGFVEKGHAETIPHYTSDRNAFRELEGMAIAFGIYDLYRQLLTEARLDEATAALEQKCVAMLKARKLQIRGKL